MEVATAPDKIREEALCRMMTQYKNDLLRMCAAYLKDSALAEDAVSETFLKTYKALETFRGDSSEKTWLMRIAIKDDHHSRRVSPLNLPNQQTGVLQPRTAFAPTRGCAVKHPHHTLRSKSCKG